MSRPLYFHPPKVGCCLSSHYAVNAAPEDRQELRTESEMHSQELNGLHLANWVSHLAISIGWEFGREEGVLNGS